MVFSIFFFFFKHILYLILMNKANIKNEKINICPGFILWHINIMAYEFSISCSFSKHLTNNILQKSLFV